MVPNRTKRLIFILQATRDVMTKVLSNQTGFGFNEKSLNAGVNFTQCIILNQNA